LHEINRFAREYSDSRSLWPESEICIGFRRDFVPFSVALLIPNLK